MFPVVVKDKWIHSRTIHVVKSELPKTDKYWSGLPIGSCQVAYSET